MPGIPEPKKQRFYQKNWFIEAFGILGVIVTGCSTVFLAYSKLSNVSESTPRSEIAAAWISIGGVIVLVLSSGVKLLQAVQKDKKEEEAERHDGFVAAAQLIHSLVRHHYSFDRKDADKLRVTIHRIVPPKKAGESSQEFEQMIDYIGGTGGGKLRRFSIRSGITGKAARENDVFAGSRNNVDHEAYIKEMVSIWGYTPEDARALNSTRNSWMAVPIKYKGEVTGVVYLDSIEKNYFPDDVKKLVVWASGGLAVFIDERYK